MQIVATYRCNAKCKWCCERLDVVDWGHLNTDITAREVRGGAKTLKSHGVGIGKLRLTGGEPLVHPNFSGICQAIVNTWTPRRGFFRVYSNGVLPKPKDVRVRYAVVKLDSRKKQIFKPFNVSPADLGMEPMFGFNTPCRQQIFCGRAFSCFGFSACAMAGVLGGMFGRDTFSTKPVLLADEDMCRHCLVSLPTRQRNAIIKGVHAGRIPPVTKTYEQGIERWKDEPPKFKRFFERVKDERP
jgi:hypothetical protein